MKSALDIVPEEDLSFASRIAFVMISATVEYGRMGLKNVVPRGRSGEKGSTRVQQQQKNGGETKE